MGERLLPAFSTPTGIPYGTVNLRHGVPSGETAIASTAGAGSLLMEFEVLSSLVGDVRFGDAAFTAAQALYNRRSYLGLLGKHIHTGTGHWHETASGVGSNADSFYEYLLKGHLLFHRPGLFVMFADTYEAVKKIVQVGDWFTEVDMFNGKSRRNRVENLQAFWPGMESIIGLCNSAARLLNNFYAVWDDIGFLPEEFDQAAWLSNQVINNSWYPLRPELIESTYFHYRSTADRSWLTAGSLFLDNIEVNTRTECGHASISNIGSMEMTNSMPSYFLSETCKYLYLLFDDDNFVHERAYMFSTEAHPFDPMQLPVRLQNADIASEVSEIVQPAAGSKILLPLKCPKNLWWDSSIVAYNSDHVRNQLADIVRTPEEELVVEDSLAARRSVTALNSDRIAQLLRQPTPQDVSNVNLHGSQSDLKMNVCYEDEGVDLLPTSQAQQAIIAKDPSPQKMSVDAGVLGVFDVSIYTDGFVVHSQRHGDTLGITNIGERLVFITHVSASPDLHSKTHTGEHSGKINTCTVSVVDANGEILDGDRERSCSLATYSTASIVFSPIIAELHIPPKINRMACKPLNLRPKSKTTVKEKSWWAQWPSASELSSLLSRPRSKSINAGPLGSSVSSSNRAKVVFAPRGDCLFEDKTLLAQEAGAIGVIIANSEVRCCRAFVTRLLFFILDHHIALSAPFICTITLIFTGFSLRDVWQRAVWIGGEDGA